MAMTFLDVLLLVTSLIWFASFCFGCYRVWAETRSIPIERLRQLWVEEERLYGGLPAGLRRPDELDEAWEQRFASQLPEPFPLLSRFLSRRRFAQWLEREIKRAHVNWDVGSTLAVLLLLMVSGFSLTAIVLSLFAPTISPLWRFTTAFLVAVLSPSALIGWLRYKQRQFIRRVETVLPDTLALMANALRAGMGFQQAIELVAMEGLPPLRDEFATVNRAITLGSSLDEALQGLIERVPSVELELVVTAVLIQREVGGSLARLLDIAASTVRNRIRLKQEIRAETSLTRGSAFALAFGLPALVFVFANFASIVTGGEPWSAPMFTTSTGLKAWIAIVALEVGGWFWMKGVLETLEG
ncbi:MAG: type II secretion system F family protein [Armatimonadetes bacterium]|nr:type II secretion system F family protein [Armatimonadota bacterium]